MTKKAESNPRKNVKRFKVETTKGGSKTVEPKTKPEGKEGK